MKNGNAVLFDCDGVLVNACAIHREALRQAVVEFGFADEYYEFMIPSLEGRPTKVKLELLRAGQSKSPPITDEQLNYIADRKQEITKVMLANLQPDPDKVALLSKLAAEGILIAVASNSLKASLTIMLDRTGLLDLVQYHVGNDEVPAPKPAPDLYLKAASELGLLMNECVIVEDSDVGMASATAAHPKGIIRVQGPHEVHLGLIERIQHIFGEA